MNLQFNWREFSISPFDRRKAYSLTIPLLFATFPSSAATIQLLFDAFIPDERVINSVADVLPPFYTSFIGDNRNFDVNATKSGQARLFSSVILDLETENPLISTFTDTSVSVGFRIENGLEVADELKSVPTSNITAIRQGDSIILDVFAEARNPLIEVNLPPGLETPPAQYDYRVILTQTENLLEYTLTGTTKAYPAYSVFIEDQPILLNTAGDESDLIFVTETIAEIQGQIDIPEPIPEPYSSSITYYLVVIGTVLLFRKRNIPNNFKNSKKHFLK